MSAEKSGYGYSLEEPIELTMVDAEYVYLNSLTFDDGSPVYYVRIGSWRAASLPNPVDKYEIYRSQEDMAADKAPDAELYLYAYADENTTEAPEGFIFHMDRLPAPDLWMMPPPWKL